MRGTVGIFFFSACCSPQKAPLPPNSPVFSFCHRIALSGQPNCSHDCNVTQLCHSHHPLKTLLSVLPQNLCNKENGFPIFFLLVFRLKEAPPVAPFPLSSSPLHKNFVCIILWRWALNRKCNIYRMSFCRQLHA